MSRMSPCRKGSTKPMAATQRKTALTGRSGPTGALGALQRLASHSPHVARLAGLGARADAMPVQRLSKQQRQAVGSYELTGDFVDKHVAPKASRRDLVSTAESRGVPASTLISATKSEIEAKALNICKTGDDSQVAAEDNARFGTQIQVRMTGLPRATILRGEFQGWNEDPFVIVGAWKGKKVQGNHFQANPTTVAANNEEIIG